MKALTISGFILSIISFFTGLYLQFILAPAADSLESSINTGFSDKMTSMMFYAAEEAKVNTGELLVIVSGSALILCMIPAIKIKSKIGIIGSLLAVAALFAGLIHGTHMFS